MTGGVKSTWGGSLSGGLLVIVTGVSAVAGVGGVELYFEARSIARLSLALTFGLRFGGRYNLPLLSKRVWQP